MNSKALSALSAKTLKRAAKLHNWKNRLARFYDNGKTTDRYTVVYVRAQWHGEGSTAIPFYTYRGMSANPTHPQGFSQMGESSYQIDRPVVGINQHCPNLGKRICFGDLPEACQRLVIQDLLA